MKKKELKSIIDELDRLDKAVKELDKRGKTKQVLTSQDIVDAEQCLKAMKRLNDKVNKCLHSVLETSYLMLKKNDKNKS